VIPILNACKTSAMASPAFGLPPALDHAVAAYRAGQYVEAEKICQQIVSTRHDFFDALYVLAVVQAALCKHDPALENYNRALALHPQHAEALSNRGNTLKALNRLEEALDSYDKAIALQPDYVLALTNRGAVLFDLKRYDDALASYDRALVIRPDHVQALYNRAGTLHALQKYEEALANYDKAIHLHPQFADAHANRGNTLNELHRFDEALDSFERALALRPNLVEALCNRGNALNKMKRFEDALASYDRALALHPGHAGSHYNRGSTLHELRRYEEALVSYDRATALRPHYPEASSNRGATLYELKRHGEALESYDRAIALQPDYPEAHWNAASLSLLIGDFTRGWAEYEWRWKYETLKSAKRNFAQPLWGGEVIDGKTILLHGEQGLGDTIQFCRYAPFVAARGGRVILEVDKRLHPLMLSLAGVDQVVPAGDSLPSFDLQCPLLSLPRVFETQLKTIPSAVPYLRATPDKSAEWSARLGSEDGYRIGLAWSGNAAHHRDQMRSISLSALLKLLDTEATFISLQKDVRTTDAAALGQHSDIIQFADALTDFSDTAALISNLDLVISVDTSIAHLAGALGRPVWILLPYLPDWRWLLDRDTSPWYPTARLFRQDDTRQWGGVLARVRDSLREFVVS
jgi:tetratricopeptide (TPR) repeat protein